eukprot:GEMP01109751.1.p1 GENE.GEMP01109751.1~~GEMP01109751.1.p1  ORF type:complete len:131 (+),score=12.15 GEMP01109751.1:49-441(+)
MMLATHSRRFIRRHRVSPDQAVPVALKDVAAEAPRAPPQYEWFPKQKGISKDIPFRVNRTANGNLPVYERFRNKGRSVNTFVSLFDGDQEAMRKALMRVCESPVRVRFGSFEVRGLHSWKIKEWLESINM